MPGDKDDKKKEEDKKDDNKQKKDTKNDSPRGSDKDDDDKRSEKGSVKDKDDKLDPEQEKAVKKMMERVSKMSTTMEQADQKIIDNARNRAEERKKLLNEIEVMKNEIDPYLEKDKEVMEQKVKEEVENALLVIMDKKYKAEQEVEELKKLLRDRNQKIYELESENKKLKERNWELEDVLKGGTGRRKQSAPQDMMNAAYQSQDIDGFERADEDQVYDQPPSQDDDDDFWQEGKTNINAYNPPTIQVQPAGFKSIPKRHQGYSANDDMAFYGVAAKKK